MALRRLSRSSAWAHRPLRALVHSQAAPMSDGTRNFPEPCLDFDYLLGNRNEIEQNITARKHRGDINKVIKLYEESKGRPQNEGLRIQLWTEAALIPNGTHPEVRDLGESPRLVREVPWRRSPELAKVRSFEEIARILFGVRRENLAHFSGEKTYFLRDAMAELEQALVRYAVDRLTRELGFRLVTVPDILSPDIIEACGMSTDGELTQVYRLDERNHGRLALSGTAEMALAGMLVNKVIDCSRGPSRFAAVSRCFRAESSRAAAERGIYRVHHFTKVEMFGVTAGKQESSDAMLREFLDIQCGLYDDLGLGYQVLDMPPHELGAPACRKFDVEAALPGREEGGTHGEISSCSNCTDYQARRLNVRDQEGAFVHTVNGTAVAVPRLMMALCEQHQVNGGAVALPEGLHKYMRGDKFLRQVHKKNRLHLMYVQSPRYFSEKLKRALERTAKKEAERTEDDVKSVSSD